MQRRRPRVLAVAGMMAAAVVGATGPTLLPAATPSAAASPDPRLAEMASPSPFRGLVYNGLSLGKKGSACDGAFEAKGRDGASLGCSHGPDPAPPGVDVRRGRSDEQLAADAFPARPESAGSAGLRPTASAGSAGFRPTASAGSAGFRPTASAGSAGFRPGASAGSAGLPTASVAGEAAGRGDAARNAAASVGAVGCVGDGVSGSRVQAIYAVPADRPDRSATVVPTIRSTYAPRIDWQLSQSAAETGGEAHLMFVTEPGGGEAGCQLEVTVAHLTSAGDDSFSDTVTELKALGYNRKDRKYVVWTDSNVVCGVGSLYSDSKAGQNNLNNGYAPMFARVDSGCWGWAEGHELMHTLGAVQKSAPHATSAGHCWDGPDDMCYDDDGDGPTTMVTACAGRNSALFDCNHDDYFYAGVPPLLSWLGTHWNTYNSSWLLRAPLPGLTITLPPILTGGSGSTTPAQPPGTSGPPGSTGPVVPLPIASGYWMLTSDGHVHPFGAAAFLGQPFPMATGTRAVDLEPTPSGGGYWVVDDTGRVRAYGDAGDRGSVDRLPMSERAVSLSATPTGHGYWVFTSRGRAVPFGDAGFFGDMSAAALNRPVIGSVATPSGQGYYLFASDGGIFTFGDAVFVGSTGAMRLNKPVVAMAVAPRQGSGASPASPGQGGYWLVGSDGGLFAFGDAGFFGSMGAVRLNRPVSAVVPGQSGYLMVGEDGGAFSFGDVSFFGSLADRPPATPVISVALRT